MTIIIGIDCAAQALNTGLVRAKVDGDSLVIVDALCGANQHNPAELVARWIGQADHALIALDAPLGWPAALGVMLRDHVAGKPLSPTPTAHELYRRTTDNVIHERLGLRPLDVGADRIARVTYSALRTLSMIAELTGRHVELAWSPSWPSGFRAIEVYPAATRVVLGGVRRGASLEGLGTRFKVETTDGLESEHVRDAIVCALSGLEFLLGHTVAPDPGQLAAAKKEGWIWAGRSRRQSDRAEIG